MSNMPWSLHGICPRTAMIRPKVFVDDNIKTWACLTITSTTGFFDMFTDNQWHGLPRQNLFKILSPVTGRYGHRQQGPCSGECDWRSLPWIEKLVWAAWIGSSCIQGLRGGSSGVLSHPPRPCLVKRVTAQRLGPERYSLKPEANAKGRLCLGL